MAYEIKAVLGEFKGNKVLSLTSGDTDKYPFTFGVAKARRILACIEDIKKFVEANPPAAPQAPAAAADQKK